MTDTKNTQEGTVELYEIGLHLVSSLPEGEVQNVFSALKSDVEKHAKVVGEKMPEQIKLAYPIKKATKGKGEVFSVAYFGWIKFNATTEEISEIKQLLDHNDDILRFIIVRTVPDAEEGAKKFLEKMEEEKIKGKIKENEPTEEPDVMDLTGDMEDSSEEDQDDLDRSIEKLVE